MISGGVRAAEGKERVNCGGGVDGELCGHVFKWFFGLWAPPRPRLCLAKFMRVPCVFSFGQKYK